MKTLLKISLVFVFALFVSVIVKAQGSQNGTITVNVPATLTLSVPTPNVDFIWNYFGGVGNKLTGQTPVTIQANVNWKFKISSSADILTSISDVISSGGKTFGAANLGFNMTNVIAGNLSLAGAESASIYGPYSGTIDWTLANLGNQFAGTYRVDVNYLLVRAAD
jgi:hypothetical protein